MNTILAKRQKVISPKLIIPDVLAYLKNQRGQLFLLLSLSVLLVVSRLPYLEKPFDEDSAANAYGGRLILEGEPLYGSYHPAHHLPAVYYVFALAFSLFGDSPAAARFFLALWLIPTVGLLYYLARTVADRKTSYLAAVLFILLSADYVLEGHTAEIELFANLPRIAATLLLLKLVERKGPDWQFSLIGLAGAVAVLFKAIYISPLLLAGLILLSQYGLHYREKGSAATLVRRFFWLGAGFLLGLLPVVLYFGLLGLLPRLALVFTLGQIHLNLDPVSPIFIFLYPLSGLALANLPWLVLGLSGALLLLLNKSAPRLAKNTILLWLGLSFLEAGFGRNPFLHYYQLIVPPLSILAAWTVTHLYQLVQAQPKLKPAAWIILALLLGSVVGTYLFGNGGYLSHYLRYKTGQESYQDFVLNSWPPTGPMFVAIQAVADYIQTHSNPDERIYVWGNETQIYYLAQRRCAVDFIWPNYVELAPIPGGLQEMQRRLLAPTTKFIVIAPTTPPIWLADGLTEHYNLVKTISNHKIYQRLDGPE